MSAFARVARVALTCGALTMAACWFVDATPDDATVLCTSDRECPSVQRCDLAAHVCKSAGSSADVTAPIVESASAAPADVKAGVIVTLTLVANEPLARAALTLAEGSVDPGLGVAELADERATFSLTIADDTPEGVVVIDRVELEDEAGNVRVQPLADVAFRVDRSAPQLLAFSAAPAHTDGLAADLPPYTDVTVDVALDEPVALVSAQFAALPASEVACAPRAGASLAFRCTLVVTEALADGLASVRIVARDVAGNETTAVTNVAVDTKPPEVAPGSARALVFAADGDLATVLAPGGAVTIDFDLDEAPSAPPRVKLILGDEALEAVVAFADRHVTAQLQDAVFTNEGAALVHVSTRDAAGHQGELELALAQPFSAGIPVVDVTPAACAHPHPPACPDGDGDGAPGVQSGCAAGGAAVDCDDADPLTFPGALDLPEDGVDNDCGFADAEPGNDGDFVPDRGAAVGNAVFVACPSESTTCTDGVASGADGNGSADQPFEDLLLAVDAAASTGAALIAVGSFDLGSAPITALVIDVPVFGAYLRNAGVWERVPDNLGVATVALSRRDVILARGAADLRYDAGALVLAPDAILARSTGDGVVALSDGARVIRGVGFSVVAEPGITGRVAHSQLGQITAGDFSTVDVVHTQVTNLSVQSAVVTAVGLVGGVSVEGAADVLVIASHLTGGEPVSVITGRVTVVDTTVRGTTAALTVCDGCDAEPGLSLIGVSIERSPGAVLVRGQLGNTVTDDAAQVAACDFAFCDSVDVVEVRAAGAPVGITGVDPFTHAAPSSAVADANGDCRPGVDGVYAVGVDEP